MHIRSIGSKLTLWYTGLLALTYLFLFIIAYALLSYSLSHDIDYALENIGGAMVEKAKTEDSSLLSIDIDELFHSFFGFSPLNRHAIIFDAYPQPGKSPSDSNPQQMSVSHDAMEKALQAESHLETVNSGDKYPLRVITIPVHKSNKLTSLVRVGMSLENMHRTKQRFLLIMGAVFPIGLLLAGGGGWLLAREALRPVDQMTQTAQKISGERLNQRLQESGNGDELDRLATTLNNMLDRLYAAFDQMRQFSGDASHELQTPLTILKGEMEVALRKQRTPQEYQCVLGSGLEEIDKINHLVEGLLLISRADSGVLGLDMQPIELDTFVSDIIEQMRTIADPYNISMAMQDAEPLAICGDKDHLRRLLHNLLGNAIKYSQSGGHVEMELYRQNEWAVLLVSDSGIGIPEKELHNIFNRFHRATATGSRDRKGFGLGLSIVDSIVKAHKGYIEVESVVNIGSSFRVFLPLLEGDEEDKIARTAQS